MTRFARMGGGVVAVLLALGALAGRPAACARATTREVYRKTSATSTAASVRNTACLVGEKSTVRRPMWSGATRGSSTSR